MSAKSLPGTSKQSSVRRWARRGFLLWAIASSVWLANSVRTQGVPSEVVRDSPDVTVLDGSSVLEFRPAKKSGSAALIFICGSGIHPHAYAPLLRPIADAGYPVFVVRLPWRFAPFDSHKDEAVDRARSVLAAHPEITHWVLAGHSLGGALAARVASRELEFVAHLVLIGTTHPKDDDMSSYPAPVTKIYATEDGIAPVERVMENKIFLPAHTEWTRIDGGNHSQFGHYGHQLFDGSASITRDAQQAVTREVLLNSLQEGEI